MGAGPVASEGPRARPRPPRPCLRRVPVDPRTSLLRGPPGMSLAPGSGRPPRVRPRRASSSGVASLPRRDANAISARRRCTWARTGSSSAVLDSAVSERLRASSRAPAWNFARAAARARPARREGSGVRATARSRKAAAAPKPPRACARAADCSSSSATSSSGTDVACARCHARRSGSLSRSVASARARWI